MAGEQPQLRRPLAGEEPIKYKDVFEMTGEMAEQPISPRDAAAMRSNENRAFGKTIKGGPASIMLTAAAMNVEAGLVPPDAASTAAVSDRGLVEGNQWHESQPAHEQMESAMSMEDIGDDKGVSIGQALQAAAVAIGEKPVDRADAAAIQAAEMIATGTNASFGSGLGAEAQAASTVDARMVYDEDKTKLSEIIGMAHDQKEGVLTTGEALEVAATICGDKPVDESDAAAIQAAEMRATGTTSPPPSGVGHQAQVAAMVNARRIYDEDKTTLAEVIGDARGKLASDKPATRRNAARVKAAEMQGDVEGLIGGHLLRDAPKESVTPGGVADTVEVAATLNQPQPQSP